MFAIHCEVRQWVAVVSSLFQFQLHSGKLSVAASLVLLSVQLPFQLVSIRLLSDVDSFSTQKIDFLVLSSSRRFREKF